MEYEDFKDTVGMAKMLGGVTIISFSILGGLEMQMIYYIIGVLFILSGITQWLRSYEWSGR